MGMNRSLLLLFLAVVFVSLSFAAMAEDQIDENKRSRNPYSWLNSMDKRARNPYSWMAYGEKRARNPYSWMMFEKRSRNPYSWMAE